MKYVITVFGLGFVGLTTGLGFAEKGNIVYGYDIDKERNENIAKGNIPFMEPMLDKILEKNLNSNFVVTNSPQYCVKESDFIFICVGTPFSNNGNTNLEYIFNAVDEILTDFEDNKKRVIVVKSTVPPSTTKNKLIPYINEKYDFKGRNLLIANNPEFLREGKCWNDFINPDRIICGVEDIIAKNMLEDLYKNFEAPFFGVTFNTAEFIKYLSNTLLATMISFSNEMSIVADLIGDINIKDSFNILHMDKRWDNCNMKSYVYPGCGYGGYCLPKDSKSLFYHSKNLGYEPKILENVIKINENMSKYMSDKIISFIEPKDKIAILGLSFKPGSDDVRESPAAKIIECLSCEGYTNIIAYDPIAIDQFQKYYQYDYIQYCDNLNETCEGADCLVVVTSWEEFNEISSKYSSKKLFDLRYFL